MKQLIIDEAAIQALATDPNGGIAVELERHGERAAQIARDNVSQPHPGYPFLNPPSDGFPMLRSGTFRDSIQSYDAVVDGLGLVVEVKADSIADLKVPFAFSTNVKHSTKKNPRAFPDQPYELIKLEQLVE